VLLVVVVVVVVVAVVVVVLCPTMCMSFCFACMCMLSTQQRLNNNKQLPINNAIVKQCCWWQCFKQSPPFPAQRVTPKNNYLIKVLLGVFLIGLCWDTFTEHSKQTQTQFEDLRLTLRAFPRGPAAVATAASGYSAPLPKQSKRSVC
jgi:hypothetical protein